MSTATAGVGDASSQSWQPEQPARPIGNVYYGTCGWTDRTLMESGGFYPPNLRSAEGRLRHYTSEFPLVEVDATFYSPPSEENARLWAERAPPGFIFDVKAFGLLTHHAVDVRRLPEAVRARLTNATLDNRRLYLRGAPDEIIDRVWALHVDALRPLVDAGKLGSVLFQFPHWFTKTRANVEYLREIRDRLPWRIASAAAVGWRASVSAERCRCSSNSTSPTSASTNHRASSPRHRR